MNDSKDKIILEIENVLKKVKYLISDNSKNLNNALDLIENKHYDDEYIIQSPIFYCIAIDFFITLHTKLKDIKSKLRNLDIWEDDNYVMVPNENISEYELERFAFTILITDIQKKDKILYNFIMSKKVQATFLEAELKNSYIPIIGEDINYMAFRETVEGLYFEILTALEKDDPYSLSCKLLYFILGRKLLINNTSEKYGSWATADEY